MKSNIKWLLAKNELTQKEAAEKLGVTSQQFSAWANAKTYPKWDKAKELANLLNCSVDDLYNE